MVRRFETVSFLSDYGHADEFVGVVKGVLRSLAPHAVVIDVCHEIPPHDVRAGALALARSVQYLPPGVVLAVVDPGVGTERREGAAQGQTRVLGGARQRVPGPGLGPPGRGAKGGGLAEPG